ncbi:MAG: aminotransferase class I/II-fold pyridoxal phosphate-dependent enzyme [Candidatus Hodarchaeales archaeon]|jgi:aspartate/methionine/tyrosine aminotransferase
MEQVDSQQTIRKIDRKVENQGHLAYRRTPIERESPEEYGYERIKYNLAESSVPDFILGNLDLNLGDLVLSYTDHLGKPRLRQSIAGEDVTSDKVLVTTGAAGALYIIATSLLKPSDHVVILHPNYVANIESPRAIGCQIDYLRLSIEEKFKLDITKLEQLIKPSTRLISLTFPQNPTGTMLSESELNEIILLAESKDITLLIDETYRDIPIIPRKALPIAASLSSNAISVSSFSKAYGLPGIRLGWLITLNDALMERFLAAKELIFICNSVVDEEIATHFMIRKNEFLPQIQSHIHTNYEILKHWIKNNDYLEWVKPSGGCVCFPRIKTGIKIDIDGFYATLKETYKTFVAPGHWFEMDERYMRIGYGYPSKQELEGGLASIIKAIEDTIIA